MDRDMLTFRYARSLAELEANPHAWWVDTQAAAAQEQSIRAELDGAQAPRTRPRWCVLVIAALALLACILATLVLAIPGAR